MQGISRLHSDRRYLPCILTKMRRQLMLRTLSTRMCTLPNAAGKACSQWILTYRVSWAFMALGRLKQCSLQTLRSTARPLPIKPIDNKLEYDKTLVYSTNHKSDYSKSVHVTGNHQLILHSYAACGFNLGAHSGACKFAEPPNIFQGHALAHFVVLRSYFVWQTGPRDWSTDKLSCAAFSRASLMSAV